MLLCFGSQLLLYDLGIFLQVVWVLQMLVWVLAVLLKTVLPMPLTAIGSSAVGGIGHHLLSHHSPALLESSCKDVAVTAIPSVNWICSV